MTHTIFNLSETNFVQMDPKTGIWNRSNGNTTARVLCVSDGCYTGMNLTLNSTNCHKKVQNYQLKAASNFCSNIRMIYPEGMSLTKRECVFSMVIWVYRVNGNPYHVPSLYRRAKRRSFNGIIYTVYSRKDFQA